MLVSPPSSFEHCTLAPTIRGIYFAINCETFQICGRRLANFHSSSLVIPSPRSLVSHCSSLISVLNWRSHTLQFAKTCQEHLLWKLCPVNYLGQYFCFREQDLQ